MRQSRWRRQRRPLLVVRKRCIAPHEEEEEEEEEEGAAEGRPRAGTTRDPLAVEVDKARPLPLPLPLRAEDAAADLVRRSSSLAEHLGRWSCLQCGLTKCGVRGCRDAGAGSGVPAWWRKGTPHPSHKLWRAPVFAGRALPGSLLYCSRCGRNAAVRMCKLTELCPGASSASERHRARIAQLRLIL